jgi:hypothetical protein
LLRSFACQQKKLVRTSLADLTFLLPVIDFMKGNYYVLNN